MNCPFKNNNCKDGYCMKCYECEVSETVRDVYFCTGYNSGLGENDKDED